MYYFFIQSAKDVSSEQKPYPATHAYSGNVATRTSLSIAGPHIFLWGFSQISVLDQIQWFSWHPAWVNSAFTQYKQTLINRAGKKKDTVRSWSIQLFKAVLF